MSVRHTFQISATTVLRTERVSTAVVTSRLFHWRFKMVLERYATNDGNADKHRCYLKRLRVYRSFRYVYPPGCVVWEIGNKTNRAKTLNSYGAFDLFAKLHIWIFCIFAENSVIVFKYRFVSFERWIEDFPNVCSRRFFPP